MTYLSLQFLAGITSNLAALPGNFCTLPPALSLCATNVVLKRMPLSDFQELVDTPLSDDVQILDIDDNPRITIGDQEDRD